MNRYGNHILALWDIRTPTTERNEKGAGSSDYGPTNTDPNEVEYVDR